MDRVELNQAIQGKRYDDWLFHEYEEDSDTPEQCLTALRDLRQLSNYITEQTKKVQEKLTFFRDNGRLDYLKNDKGVIVHNDTFFSFIEGRKIYDYSNCPDILEKEAELKELKNTAKAIGAVDEKQSSPSWRVTNQ